MREFWTRGAKPLTVLAVPLFTAALAATTVQFPKLANEALQHGSYAVTPTAAIDTSADAVGIAESELYFMSDEEVDTTLDAMQEMGVTQVRMFVPWRAVEPLPDVYNWTDVDKVVDAAAERDIAVLGAVTSTPIWASDVQNSAYGAPRNPEDFGNFMGELATRYGAGEDDPESARISAYEVWNEPQSFVFWNPRPDPAAYTELLKSAYTAVKEVDPTGTVVGGVVTAGLSWGGININPVEFVDEMYANGAAGHFDALSYHPYNYDWKFGDGAGNAISALGQLQSMQALMEQNGDAGKTVWTSEYGLPTSYVSESQQAEFIGDFMDTWSELDDVGPMFIYSMVDRKTDSADVEDTWGLFRDDWTPKQAAAVVEAWIEEHSDAGTPDETPETEPTQPANPLSDMQSALNAAAQNWSDALAATTANWSEALGQTQSAGTTSASDDKQDATDPEPETGKSSTAVDPVLDSVDSLRTRLVELTQAEPSGSTTPSSSKASEDTDDDADAKSDSKSDSKSETKSDTDTKAESKSDSKSEAKSDTDTKSADSTADKTADADRTSDATTSSDKSTASDDKDRDTGTTSSDTTSGSDED